MIVDWRWGEALRVAELLPFDRANAHPVLQICVGMVDHKRSAAKHDWKWRAALAIHQFLPDDRLDALAILAITAQMVDARCSRGEADGKWPDPAKSHHPRMSVGDFKTRHKSCDKPANSRR
jgi:hypothetical protein